MHQPRAAEARRTAIPNRFHHQRERVLRILDGWEASVRFLAGDTARAPRGEPRRESRP